MRRPPVGTPAVASDGEELKALVGDEKSTADLAQEKKAKSQIVFAIVGYATCSSLMLIINKLSMHLLPAASFVLFLQLATCAVVVKACALCKLIECDNIVWEKTKVFGVVALVFVSGIFANMKTLQYCNVETFIVFRSSTPLVISLADWAFLGRELPTKKSWLSLLLIVAGSVSYMMNDANFQVKGYAWVAAWYVIFSFDQIYIKHAVNSVKLTNWGRVYYTNLLSTVPLLVTMPMFSDQSKLLSTEGTWSAAALGAVGLSCAMGCAISYFSYLCRSLVSATYFTVIGNFCKVATVVINVLIWDKHATLPGLGSLGVCLAAAMLYEQAPMRSVATDVEEKA